MADLIKLFNHLGEINTVTYIKSGNIIFEHKSANQQELSNLVFEKKLKVTATTRNWSTVINLLEISSI